LKTWPRCRDTSPRTIESCRNSASCIARRPCSHRRVLPSISVKANVTIPVGRGGSRLGGGPELALTDGVFVRLVAYIMQRCLVVHQSQTMTCRAMGPYCGDIAGKGTHSDGHGDLLHDRLLAMPIESPPAP
jgi:hypothetical protein